uniref:Uncharacterized protein n=1 Tax=viral metagenome TaxID=1070528 RepID=A0A6C0B4H7_9ZZZZ
MIWEHWTKYYDTDNANEKNFEKNMEAFSTRVNGFMEEGWRPLGPPQFSAGWFTGCTNTGSAVWTVIRELDSPQIKHPDNEE